MAGSPEEQPLLSHPRSPRLGVVPSSQHILSDDRVNSSETDTPSLLRGGRIFPLSFRANIILIMVAIPAYLLASSAVSWLGPLTPLDTASRPPEPESPHQTSYSESLSTPSTDPFASVIGPLIETNFPDPAVFHVDGVSYAFATNNRGEGADMVHVQIATSTDNQTWTLIDHHDALPQIAAWQTGARVWAPDVIQLDDGSFVLYYADALASSPAFHCVGAATSQNVIGPYVPLDHPLACPDILTKGGAIDADGFYDPSTGKRYVVYKTDGNSLGHGGDCGNSVAPVVPTPIMLQEVGLDGISLVGDAVQILDRDEIDGPLIEAPSLHRSEEGIYFLFFSSNCFTTPKYDVSYATATNIYGPYTKAARPLLVTSDANLVGPGGLDIIKGGDLIVFHGHITVNNNSAYKQEAEKAAASTGKPIADVNLPVIRGMWSATATFRGTDVLLD